MNSIEDELALRNLMGRYVDAVFRSDVDAWAATWAEDGCWNLVGTEVTGRANIVGLWQKMMAGFEFALMMPSSCQFEVAGDQAKGHYYLQEFTRDKEGETATLVSRYQDTYRRVDGNWFYQSRKYEIIYHGPTDFSGNYFPSA
ncbi:MAG: ketosteroid isomerase-like protein [Alcanivorax sp.]|jgi:ketosteroid isomerase-like protein